MKKGLGILLCGALLAGLLTGCTSGGGNSDTNKAGESGAQAESTESAGSAASGETGTEQQEDQASAAADDLSGTTITFLNTKAEIQDNLEAMAAAFKEETGITVEYYTVTEENHIAEKYAAGEPYTITMMDYPDVADYQEYLYDLSNEKWIADGGRDYGLTLDGKVYGFPFVIEAMGMVYNADAIEKITGEPFKPEDYASAGKFEELLQTLKDGGMEYPVAVNRDDWSLASHLFGQLYCLRGDGSEQASLSFVDELKTGSVKLTEDSNFNALMDTIDTLLAYNVNSADPLSASYDLNCEYLADGTVAFWPNGSWATDLYEYTDKIGIMPLPLNGTDASLSTGLISGATKMLAVDAAYSTEAEQKAALQFLDFLVYSEAGQKFLVKDCALIAAFSNFTLEAETPLSASVFEFVKDGRTTWWYQAMPSDHNTEVGTIMQKYISGAVDRAEMAAEVEAYWNGKQ